MDYVSLMEPRVKLPIVEANSVGPPVPNSNTAIGNNWNFYFYWTLIQIFTFDNLKTLQSDEIDMFYSIVKDGFEEE